jgi:hypothetical protein
VPKFLVPKLPPLFITPFFPPVLYFDHCFLFAPCVKASFCCSFIYQKQTEVVVTTRGGIMWKKFVYFKLMQIVLTLAFIWQLRSLRELCGTFADPKVCCCLVFLLPSNSFEFRINDQNDV